MWSTRSKLQTPGSPDPRPPPTAGQTPKPVAGAYMTTARANRESWWRPTLCACEVCDATAASRPARACEVCHPCEGGHVGQQRCSWDKLVKALPADHPPSGPSTWTQRDSLSSMARYSLSSLARLLATHSLSFMDWPFSFPIEQLGSGLPLDGSTLLGACEFSG